MSTKGGDDAKIRVSLSFDGLPNAAALRTAHAPHAATLVKETGRWTVWRKAKIVAYVQQATPSRESGTPDWAEISARWGEAFIEMENGGSPLHTISYTSIVTEAVYKAAILGLAQKPVGVTDAASITYRPGSLYGGPDLPQRRPNVIGPDPEGPAAYIARASNYMYGWVATGGGAGLAVINAVLARIHAHVRQTQPEGLIIFDFRVHEPVSGRIWNETTSTFDDDPNPAHHNYVHSYRGWVQADGAVTMDVDNPYNVATYVLHECGHARFLYHHWVTDDDNNASDEQPSHHDQATQKCTMSYTVDNDEPDDWTYPYCGKCILRLRGWDVRAQ
jgi:hypothetical protein